MYGFDEIMPESGQFVAVWEYNDRIWASTFCLRENQWLIYNDSELSGWENINHPRDRIPFNNTMVTNINFIILQH